MTERWHLDDGEWLAVCDLRVAPRFRGRDIGQSLLERVQHDRPDQLVYVMSDADGYDERPGYHTEGSVVEVGRIEAGSEPT